MKIITWNVNGIRAACKKGFLNWLQEESPDILCIQETKAQVVQLDPSVLAPEGYTVYWNSAERKGYSGVATFCKEKAISVTNGIGVKRFDEEGRVQITEFAKFTLFNVYFPNGTSSYDRVEYKLDFYDALLDYCVDLMKAGKNVIVCGDYNTAHQEIDLARPKENIKNSGFLPEEREKIDEWVAAGFVDIFRTLHPEKKDQFSWWSYRTKARDRNIGWRIDYHLVTEKLVTQCKTATILQNVLGSDHCPVLLEL